MYSAGFAATIEYLHTLFLVSVFPAPKWSRQYLFFVLIRKEEITQKIVTFSTSCIAFFFFSYQRIFFLSNSVCWNYGHRQDLLLVLFIPENQQSWHNWLYVWFGPAVKLWLYKHFSYYSSMAFYSVLNLHWCMIRYWAEVVCVWTKGLYKNIKKLTIIQLSAFILAFRLFKWPSLEIQLFKICY